MNEIYVKNHHPKYNYLMDIRDFNKKDDLPEELYNLDILDGSPPCSTFSMAGQREEAWGKEKRFREGQKMQTLDDLIFIFLDTVNKLKPKVFVMENVEGLLLGEAWAYVQNIYKRAKEIGYQLKHYLLKGELMGVPQTRHRVFFIGVRNDIAFDFENLDMTFNYEPVTYGEIKEGAGTPIKKDTMKYNMLQKATHEDLRVSDIYLRLGEKERAFGAKIAWEENVLQTLTAKLEYVRGEEKQGISVEDIIHAQTFPEDYKFKTRQGNEVAYICGMSVPPIMIKRLVERVINTGVFERKEQNNV